MTYKIVAYLLIMPTLLTSACRQTTYRPEDIQQQQPSHQNVVVLPVAVPQQAAHNSEYQQDRDFFLTLLSVAASFGGILLDPHNKPSVLNNVGNMINGIVQAAEIITKQHNRGITYPELCVLLATALQRQAHQVTIISKM